MVTVKFATFDAYKSYITNLGIHNPNRVVPYRFHSLAGNNTVNKMAEIHAGGSIIFLYDSPTSETILPTDDWFKANEELKYPASVLIADVGESIT